MEKLIMQEQMVQFYPLVKWNYHVLNDPFGPMWGNKLWLLQTCFSSINNIIAIVLNWTIHMYVHGKATFFYII